MRRGTGPGVAGHPSWWRTRLSHLGFKLPQGSLLERSHKDLERLLDQLVRTTQVVPEHKRFCRIKWPLEPLDHQPEDVERAPRR